jgi:Uma2 family endonuclease
MTNKFRQSERIDITVTNRHTLSVAEFWYNPDVVPSDVAEFPKRLIPFANNSSTGWGTPPGKSHSGYIAMITNARMTAKEFAERKHELPEGGRWHELHEGLPILMESPDDSHGNAVLNLSRALAEWFAGAKKKVGYACHEIGLHVSREPCTVHCPAISYFDTGEQFGETDKEIASLVPKLVIDIASSNDRRREMRRRSLAYAKLGVATIWIPDTTKQEVQVISKGAHTLALAAWQSLDGQDTLQGFSITVKDVFAQPKWWR